MLQLRLIVITQQYFGIIVKKRDTLFLHFPLLWRIVHCDVHVFGTILGFDLITFKGFMMKYVQGFKKKIAQLKRTGHSNWMYYG